MTINLLHKIIMYQGIKRARAYEPQLGWNRVKHLHFYYNSLYRYKLSVFRCLLHYLFQRAVDIWLHSCFGNLAPPTPPLTGLAGAKEYTQLSFPVQCLSSSKILFFFCAKHGYFHFCEAYTIEVLTCKKININVKHGIVISEWLTLSWFVATCNLSHLTRGTQ